MLKFSSKEVREDVWGFIRGVNDHQLFGTLDGDFGLDSMMWIESWFGKEGWSGSVFSIYDYRYMFFLHCMK